MDFFDELNRSISGVSKVGSLKTLIRDEEKQINALYVEIGTRYFESNKNDPNAPYASQIAQIKASLERIDGYNQQIYMTRGGAPARPVCTKCGNPLAPADKFCALCGTRVGVQQPTGKPCVKCGATVSQGSAFCSVCGARQTEPQPEEKVTCAVCGAQMKADAAFCIVCGAKVDATAETPVADVEPTVEEIAVPAATEITEPEIEIEIIEPQNTTVVSDVPAEEFAEEPEVLTATEEISVCEETAVTEETAAVDEAAQEITCEVPEKLFEDINPYEALASDDVCKACGKEVASTAKFCIYCGTKR